MAVHLLSPKLGFLHIGDAMMAAPLLSALARGCHGCTSVLFSSEVSERCSVMQRRGVIFFFFNLVRVCGWHKCGGFRSCWMQVLRLEGLVDWRCNCVLLRSGSGMEVLVLLRCCRRGGDSRSGVLRSCSWWRWQHEVAEMVLLLQWRFP